MSNSIYAAFKEMNIIIENSDIEVQEKIPQRIKEHIKENMDKDYNVTINFNEKLVNQDILPETKEMMAILYRDYLCSEEERKKIMKRTKELYEELEQKYDISHIFEKKKKIRNERIESQLPLVIKQKKWYEKIIEIFLKIIKNN